MLFINEVQRPLDPPPFANVRRCLEIRLVDGLEKTPTDISTHED